MTSQGIAIPGPWVLPPAVQAISDMQTVPYTGSIPIRPDGMCTNANAFACSCTHPACSRGLPGTLEFAGFIRRRFPQITSAGGFSCCRQNTGNTSLLSVHSLGRAIDLSIPRIGGDADNTLGDEVANWLISHAQEIGVQYVAWDRMGWNASRPAGRKLIPYNGPIPHTDHIHMELSIDGANRRTPFFLAGGINGGRSCASRCEGTAFVTAECDTGDCAVRGATCVADPAPRCVAPACPPMGTATVCLDANRLANCVNGSITSMGDCSAFGAFCSIAGATPTTARCHAALCVGGPMAIPEAHRQCHIAPGQMLDCLANGGATPIPCPAGQICSMLSGTAACVPPNPMCPVPARIPPHDDRTVCIDSQVARCFNGNIYSSNACSVNSVCSSVGGTAHCAQRACLMAGVVRAGDVCSPGGLIATCDPSGLFENIRVCAMGQTCSSAGGPARCVVGMAMGMDDDDLAIEPVAEDGGVGGDAGDGDAGGDAGVDALRPRDAATRMDVTGPPEPQPGCACRSPINHSRRPTHALALCAMVVAVRSRRRASS